MKLKDAMAKVVDRFTAGSGISIEGQYIIIRGENSFTYEIPLEQCNTVCGALAWVMHMMEKNWVTQDKLETIVALMYRHAHKAEEIRDNGL